MTQSSCKRDTKSKSHPSVKLALVRVFSCKHPLSVYNTPLRGAYPNVASRHNLVAWSKGLFGTFVAIALVNGCPGPHFLTPMITGSCSFSLIRHGNEAVSRQSQNEVTAAAFGNVALLFDH